MMTGRPRGRRRETTTNERAAELNIKSQTRGSNRKSKFTL